MADSVPEAKSKAESFRVRFSEPVPFDQTVATAKLANNHDGAREYGVEETEVFYNDEGLVLENLGFESVVVVDNLPIVGHGKAVKLESDLRKLLGRFGSIKSDRFSMPVDPRTLETRGYCFVEFNTRQEAEVAVKNMDGSEFNNYRLSVTFYEDSHKPENTIPDSESYMISEMREYDDSEDNSGDDDDEFSDSRSTSGENNE